MFNLSSKARYVVVLRAGSWRRIPMKLLKWRKKMPSTKQYNLVPNDEFDTRIPLHPEEAFTYGIAFKAKFIGSMEVPRPTSRVEIVAAMRRVRYEFKAKGAKKSKVTFDVSTDGVRVTTRKKKVKTKKKDAMLLGSDANNGMEIMHHPIYRIFYVSHDSSDLKIFSFIARDGATNAFKCNVFKSNKKSQAMRIVRTVGQAFEVCHKQQTRSSPDPAAASSASAHEDPAATPTPRPDTATEADTYKSGAWSAEVASECEVSSSVSRAPVGMPAPENPAQAQLIDLLPPPPRKDHRRSPRLSTPTPTITVADLTECLTEDGDVDLLAEGAPLTAQHHVQLLRERLQQQAQQTRAAVAQLLLLRDQLAAEQTARVEAQARTHQLLVHNKELLEHIAALVSHLQAREKGSTKPISAQQLTLLPQKAGLGTAEFRPEDVSRGNERNNNVAAGSPPSFADMTDEEIQTYLITKFQPDNVSDKNQNPQPKTDHVDYSQQFFQNCNAFPNIPPLKNHHSNMNISSLMNHNLYKLLPEDNADGAGVAGSAGISCSESSVYCASGADSSRGSSPSGSSEDSAFILPLSHRGTVVAPGADGRMRVLVPISPSSSGAQLPATPDAPAALLAPPGPPGAILRTTSEKAPSRSESMSTLRSQWTRHTTK